MKIAVCEDEAEARLELQTLIEALGHEVMSYKDAESLLKDWERGTHFDAVFTDIIMEQEPVGMDLCRRLSAEGRIFLVIVTNYIEYAPEGYRNGVFRYLMKPLKPDAIQQVFEDMEAEIPKNEKLVVEALYGERVICCRDILYVEVQGRYLDICLTDSQGRETAVTLMQSLREFSAELPKKKFFRINRNQMVNLERITMVKQGSLCLDNGKVLPISRRQQKQLQEALARYLA